MRKLFLCLLPTILLFSCSTQEEAETTSAFDNLLGTWKIKDQPSYERWEKYNNDVYRAMDFTALDGDTAYTERIVLFDKAKDDWSYEVELLGKGEVVKKVAFGLDSLNTNTLYFSNPENSFPKGLVYHFPNDSIMQVSLQGQDSEPVYLVFKKHE